MPRCTPPTVFHVAPRGARKAIGREGLRPLGGYTPTGKPNGVYVFTEVFAARLYAYWEMRRLVGDCDLWRIDAAGLTFARDPQGSAKMLYTTDVVGPERLTLEGKA